MKRLILSIALVITALSAFAQHPAYIRGDTIYLTNSGKNAVIVLQNSTYLDSGFLKNVGNGRVEYVKPQTSDVVGLDSILAVIGAGVTGHSNGIASGLVLSASGTSASVTPGGYYINDTLHTKTGSTTLTIPAQGVSNSQYVTVYGDSTGAIHSINGTASLTPVAPDVPGEGVLIGTVYITPSGVGATPPPATVSINTTGNQTKSGILTLANRLKLHGGLQFLSLPQDTIGGATLVLNASGYSRLDTAKNAKLTNTIEINGQIKSLNNPNFTISTGSSYTANNGIILGTLNFYADTVGSSGVALATKNYVNNFASKVFAATTYQPIGTYLTPSSTNTLTNKSISGSTNTLSNIGNSSLVNPAITLNGNSTALGGSVTVTTSNTDTTSTGFATQNILKKYITKAQIVSTYQPLLTGTGFIKSVSGSISYEALVSLSSEVTNTLPVANGGTGVATLTGIVKANGTGAFTAAVAGTDYQAPLTFDSTPTSGSSNGVTSGGVYTVESGKLSSTATTLPSSFLSSSLTSLGSGVQLINPKLNTTSTVNYIWTATDASGDGSWQLPNSTYSVAQTVNIASTGTSVIAAFTTAATTAATNGNPQYSPAFILQGNGWQAGSTSSVPIDFRQYVSTFSSGTSGGQWNLQHSVNGAAYTTDLTDDQSGNISVEAVLYVYGLAIFEDNFRVNGTSSGTVNFNLQAAAGSYNWEWPTTAGTAGQLLTSQGGGTSPMTWTNAPVYGQTTLVAGTKTISITGLTTSSKAIVSLASQGGTVTTTVQYEATCTSGTLTLTALTSAGATNTSDTSTVTYSYIP